MKDTGNNISGGKWKGTSLVFNTGAMTSAAILAAALLAVAFINWSNAHFYDSEVRKNVEMIGTTLGAQIVGPLSIEDRDALTTIVADSIGSNQQLQDYMVVTQKDGLVFSDSGTKRTGKKYVSSMKRKGLDYVVLPLVLETKFGFMMEGNREKIGKLMLGVKHENFLKNERIRTVVSFARGISRNVAEAADSGDFIRVRDLMNNLVSNRESMEYAELIHSDGTILFFTEGRGKGGADSEKEGAKETSAAGKRAMEASAFNPVVIQNTKNRKGEPVIDISVPVMNRGNKLGVVRIGYSMKDFLEKQRRTRNMMIWAAVAAVVAGLIFSTFASLRLSGPIRALAAAARDVGLGDMERRVNIKTGGWETRELGASFNQMIQGLKERDLVKDTFSRYVTKQVADEILKNPDMTAPGGKKQEVTILFSDIRGFTTFSEKHPPEVVIARLNEYLSEMVDVIFKYEGTLDKFIGDAIMAVFGAPIAHDDDPLRAMKTALEMQEALKKLNERWAAEGKEPLQIGVGVNTGEVIVGNIGDIRRMEYTVIGDAVNLASRVEGLTKDYGCPIIISEGSYAKAKDHVEVRRLGNVTVKGKSEQVEIFELTGLKG